MFINGVPSTTTSSVRYITMPTMPYAMWPPVNVTVSPFSISLTWPELGSPYNGGTAITFYKLEWFDYNTNLWTALTFKPIDGLVLAFTHTLTVPFDPTKII